MLIKFLQKFLGWKIIKDFASELARDVMSDLNISLRQETGKMSSSVFGHRN